jgi:RHS repeat-associated protein
VVDTDAYDPDGATTGSTVTVANPYRFGGMYGAFTEGSSGLVKIGERYYDTSVGRWTQLDPLGGSYEYATSDPANATDPTGLGTLGLCSAGSAGLAVWVAAAACPTVSSTGEVGTQTSVGGGGTTGGFAGFSIGIQFGNADTLADLRGPFVTAGFAFAIGAGIGIDGFYGLVFSQS